MYSLPQEIEVWYVIPGIRKELAKCLIKNHGITYEKVGKSLGITKAAVSQYIKNKRASKIRLHDKALKEVCKSCNLIVKKNQSANKEIMRILKFIRDKNLPCEVCDKKTRDILEGCKEFTVNYDV
jgi:uncharacterized protein